MLFGSPKNNTSLRGTEYDIFFYRFLMAFKSHRTSTTKGSVFDNLFIHFMKIKFHKAAMIVAALILLLPLRAVGQANTYYERGG